MNEEYIDEFKGNIKECAKEIWSFYKPKLSTPKCELKFYLYKKDDSRLGSFIPRFNNLGKVDYFIIALNINCLDGSLILETVCHEIVHFDQFNRGDLEYTSRYCFEKDNYVLDKMLWRGKDIPRDQLKYTNNPWEIEAYDKEFNMLVEFADVVWGIKPDKGEYDESIISQPEDTPSSM